MTWIKTIPYQEADGKLKKIYDRVKGPNNNIDNVLSIHSLRPHSLVGHMHLYKSVLHNSNNTLPKWYLEVIGVYVSMLNKCDYCVDHHFSGLSRLIDDHTLANKIWKAAKENDFSHVLDDAKEAGLVYARKLTQNLTSISEEDIEQLRKEGFSDGEILEINQVISYFNYVNRTVLGLGVTTKGDILGLSPNNSDNSSDWGHQ